MILDRLATHAGPAIDFLDGPSLTYPQLWAKVQAFAERAPSADVALIFLPMGEEAVVAFLGCMAAGVLPSFMPLPSAKQDPAAYWSSHRQLFQHIGDGAIIAPAEFLDQIREHAPDCPLTLLEAGGSGAARTAAPRSEAFLQHSSGTTGLKKGVVITHEQLARQLGAYAEQLRITRDSVIVSWLPLYHDMGLIACFLLPLFVGCRVVYIDTFRWNARPKLLFRAIEEFQGTHIWMPNFAFSYMAAMPIKGHDLSSVEAFINCSEACRPEAFDRFQTAFAALGLKPNALTCCYAMAETVFAVSQSDGERTAHHGVLSSGRPVSGIEVRVVDAEGEPADFGEIEVRGDFVFSGYYRDPERTAAAFRDGWYRTRDLGSLIHGQLYVAGRTDDMLIVNGRNLFAHQLEYEAGKIDGVLPGRVAAFSIDADGMTALVVACESDRADIAPEVADKLNTIFGLVPRVVAVEPKTILKTTSGKMDRKRNRERYLAGELVSWQ